METSQIHTHRHILIEFQGGLHIRVKPLWDYTLIIFTHTVSYQLLATSEMSSAVLHPLIC